MGGLCFKLTIYFFADIGLEHTVRKVLIVVYVGPMLAEVVVILNVIWFLRNRIRLNNVV